MTAIKHKTDAAMPVSLPHYDAKGILQDIVTVDENGQVNSVTEFYPDKSVKATYEMRNGLKDGEFISFYPNGEIDEYGFYMADKKNGRYTKNHPNGALWIEQTFLAGKLHGKVCYYDADTGAMTLRMHLRNDVLHGLYESFDTKGRRQSSIQYRGGNENDAFAPAPEAVLF